MRIDPDILMKLIRQHFNDDAAKPLVCTRWKDGIDIDRPTYAIEAFAESIAALVTPPMCGQVNDPKFRPTKEDLDALRADASKFGREGMPVTVNAAPAVLYMAWPNRQHDPRNPDSAPYRCISFSLT